MGPRITRIDAKPAFAALRLPRRNRSFISCVSWAMRCWALEVGRLLAIYRSSTLDVFHSRKSERPCPDHVQDLGNFQKLHARIHHHRLHAGRGDLGFEFIENDMMNHEGKANRRFRGGAQVRIRCPRKRGSRRLIASPFAHIRRNGPGNAVATQM